jgi:hypothetical protein
MKSFLFKSFVALCFCMALVGVVFGQSPDLGIDPTNPDDLGKFTELIYGVMVILGGYISHKIPAIGTIKDSGWRTAATALTIGIAFLCFGWSSALKLLLTFATSTSFYELILSRLPNAKSKQLNPEKASYIGA